MDGNGPKESLLIPDVDSLGTCFPDGVSDSPVMLPAVLPPVLFLLLIVTLDGMWAWPNEESDLGEARGGVLTGAGSFDLADWTRCSRRCICAVRVLICVSDVEFVVPLVAAAFVLVLLITAGVAFLLRFVTGVGATEGPRDARKLPEGILVLGFGVVLESAVGTLSLLRGFIGVITTGRLVVDDSDTGGEGGVADEGCVDTDCVSGGVVIMGEEAVETGEPSSKPGVFGAEMSVAIEASCRLRNLSCMISASTFRSDSSSRNLCVSIRSVSRSCSPTLISSSIITALSIATLYFDSRSSREDVVFRACLSKSSLETSMSRNLSCKVRFESRKMVISFCKVFCAAPASVFACLYFVYGLSDTAVSV